MTPKEKAEELISKYIIVQDEWYLDKLVDGLRIAQAKRCALIAVDEILFIVSKYNDTQAEVAYWKEVKQEIEKL